METNALLSGLNPSQQAAVLTVDGPVLVLAGAGTGKTETLVRRIANMVLSHGIDPQRILAVTFSRDAAAEMNTRLVRWLGATDARVGTFHSVALGIIRAERIGGRDWELQESMRPIVKVAAGWGEGNLDWKDADPTYLDGFISAAKVALIRPGTPEALELARKYALRDPGPHARPEKVAAVYARAEELRIGRGVITFDDFVPMVVWAFQADDALRRRWAERWTHGLQDETQDQGLDQLTLAELLCKDHGNYMVVGDPAQSIYGFRGAVPERLLSFATRWPNAKVVKLEHNYRSQPQVLSLANAVVNTMGYGDATLNLVPVRDGEADIRTTVTLDFDTEASSVAEDYTSRHADGQAWKGMAVLVRTHAQTRALEEAFLSARVPYVIAGAVNFYERQEVKTLLSYLRVVSDRGTLDDVRRVVNAPNRYLGKVFLAAVEEAYTSDVDPDELPEWETAEMWASVITAGISRMARINQNQTKSAKGLATTLRRFQKVYAEGMAESATEDQRSLATPGALLSRLVEELDYIAWLTGAEGRETPENSRVSNVREMVRASARFATVQAYLEHVAETVRRAAEARKKGANVDAVTVTTIHRSKGLEWPVVTMVGVNEGILPHARGDEAEERRLFYVGVTRARDVLRVSLCELAVVNGKERRLTPSRYLKLAGLL